MCTFNADELLPADAGSTRAAARVAAHESMLLENLNDAVVGLDAQWRVDAWNRAAERVFGWRRDEVVGRPFLDVVPSQFPGNASFDEVLERIGREGRVRWDVRRRTRSGEWIEVESTAVALRAADGTITGYVSVNRDVSLRKRAEAALRASQERLQRILETLNEGIWVVDARGTTEFVNARAAELFEIDVEEAIGRSFLDALPEQHRSLARDDAASLLRGDPVQHELMVRRRDGSTRCVVLSQTPLRHADGRVAGAVVVLLDVTALRQAREELQQGQKLEAVGRLASGIAHEINTPIQYVGDNTHFLGEAFTAVAAVLARTRDAVRAECSAPVREELDRAEREVDLEYLLAEAPGTVAKTLDGIRRVATLVRAMKEFAHPDQKEMVSTDVNRALLATLEVARNEYKYVADVETELADVPPVTCHAGELNQVFLNIIINAAHAIEDAVAGRGERGKIRVSTRREGAHLVVAIADTGCGIPEDNRDKIFEPFFTTKKVGRGTGQGLAIARNVVAKHHGQLTFTSAPGVGTTFFVRLPLETSAAQAEVA
ncbi:MAG: PAS domain S-box protein [Anaeromyxobacteraceae bacterium]